MLILYICKYMKRERERERERERSGEYHTNFLVFKTKPLKNSAL